MYINQSKELKVCR